MTNWEPTPELRWEIKDMGGSFLSLNGGCTIIPQDVPILQRKWQLELESDADVMREPIEEWRDVPTVGGG